MDFRKVIYENVEKKPFISQHTYLYVRVTDIPKFYEVLFCTFCTGLSSLKNSHYAYIPPYMHKILPTLGNEKEQHKLNFTKNSQTSWFSRLTLSKCSISLARLGKKSKVTPLKMHTDGVMHTQKFMQYWFLCVKIIWICQSPTQTIVLQGNKNNHYHSVFNF